MPKVKLGQCPKNFNTPVRFSLLDGSEGEVGCVFKYRTQTEFAEFIEQVGLGAPELLSEGFKNLVESTVSANAAYLAEVLDGWDLDVPFSIDALRQFCDEMPGGASAIMTAYRVAIREGRLGN